MPEKGPHLQVRLSRVAPEGREDGCRRVVSRSLIAAVPCRVHIVLTDNGIQFTNHDRDIYAFQHIFDRVCRAHQITTG